MRYEGNIFRPPSEAYSLIVQVTIGCAHNDCTFCSMFKDKVFRVRPVGEVIEDLEGARRSCRSVRRIFLADGDALALSTDKLLAILGRIEELFPEVERVGVYGSPQDVLRKSPEELARLLAAGVGIIYIGAESGSDAVLRDVKKGATAAEIIEAIRKIEDAGIEASVTFISGLAGAAGWEDHAVMTGRMISESQPSYVGLLTLMLDPSAPIYADVQSGRFKLLSPMEVIDETALMIENTDIERDCVFRSNHASNYFSLKGTLPRDKERLLAELGAARGDEGLLKDERFRLL
ncbi:MAG: B12-binding domain-containing radical SAM protein [Clostridiales Family XIII bacterium]|jgi:biotin synthase-like enzyme|nr:B12-binding domain-containing radical SAM protein [Clostridiales Family XIII bacterium]